MKSIWLDTTNIKEHESLNKDINTDVLVIGGGITGILCTYELKNKGIDVVLVEADKIAKGVTANTTAKITSQHGFIYNKLDTDTARLYYRANEEALQKYKDLSKTIDMELEEKDNYVYTLNDMRILYKEMAILNQINAKAEIIKPSELPINTLNAIRFKKQAQFNPLKLIEEISKDLTIYENTKVIELETEEETEKIIAHTKNNKITANKVIVATHFPIFNKFGAYFLKLYQERSYVIAVKNAELMPGMYIDGSANGLSFRTYKNLLLVGGGNHRTGKHGGGWNYLRNFIKSYYPNAVEQYHWATQDCMSLDHLPYIGLYSPKLPNVYVATGFNKWGMTTSMVAATLLTNLITGNPTPYEHIFNPSRSILKPQLLINGLETTLNLLTPTKPRCPHLGCALKYNKEEHTWDCPCHGSRFTEKGELIENPATDDLKIKE